MPTTKDKADEVKDDVLKGVGQVWNVLRISAPFAGKKDGRYLRQGSRLVLLDDGFGNRIEIGPGYAATGLTEGDDVIINVGVNTGLPEDLRIVAADNSRTSFSTELLLDRYHS